MTASKQIKGLLAGLAAFAVIGTAMAQGSPPNPAVKNAPIGAGQQSSQKTPMGETGVQSGGTTAAAPMNPGSTNGSMKSGSTSSTSSMGGTSVGSTGSTDTAMASSTGTGSRAKRRMRADRN